MSTAFDEWDQRRRDAERGKVKALVVGAPPVAPQQASEIDTLARDYGVPSSVVRADPDTFKRHRTAERAVDAVASAPRLGSWLAKGELNAAKAGDSLPDLSHVEKALRAPLAKPEPPWFKLPEGLDLSAVMTGPAGPLMSWLQPKLERGIENAVNDTHSAYRAGELTATNTGRALGAGAIDLAEQGSRVAEIMARHNLYTGGAINPQNQENAAVFGYMGDKLRAWAEDAAPDPTTAAGRNVMSGFRSIPATGAAILSGGLTGSARVGATTLGIGVGAQSYARGREAGLGEGQALGYGAVDAAIETGTEIGPLAKIFGHLGDATGFGKRLWQSFKSEIPNEQIATLGQDFNAWVNIEANQGKTFNDFVAERWSAATSTLVATVIGSGTVLTATHALAKANERVARRFETAQTAARTEQLVTRLQEIAAAAPLAARDKDSFADFVRHAAEDSEAREVFVDANELAAVFEQSGLKPEELAERLPGVAAQMEIALETGSAVRIPIEDLAARAGDLADALTPHLKLDPNGMSPTEAKEFLKGAQEELETEATAIFEQASEQSAFEAEVDQVREMVATELEATQRFTPEVNTLYAALHGNFFGRLALDTGESPLALAQRYGLQVRARGGGLGAGVLDQLREYSRNSPTGKELQRRVEKSKYGHLRGLVDEATGKTIWWDSALKTHDAAAKELGIVYFPGNRDNRLFARKDENGVITIDIGDDTSASAVRYIADKDALTDIFEFNAFNGRFSSMAFLDEVDQFKSGVAFRKWFGDSKVVDDKGAPLVVYHGSNQSFAKFAKARGGQATTKNAAAGEAFFFTDSADEAGQYAENAASRVVSNIADFEKKRTRLRQEVDRLEQQARRTGNWDAYEKAMVEWEDLEIGATQEDDLTGRNILPVYLSMQNPLIADFSEVEGEARVGYLDRMAKAAKKKGHDGLVLRNISDSPKGGIISTHYAVFKPEQIKSVNNRGTWDANDARILYQTETEPKFYSALLRAVETSKQGKATPAEWKGILQNAPGVKPDELHWSGTLDLLAMREESDGPKTAIPREELASLVGLRGLVVKEVLLGGEKIEVSDDTVWEMVQQNRRDAESEFDPAANGLVGSVVRGSIGTHPDRFEDDETPIHDPDVGYRALDASGNTLKDDDGDEVFATREEAETIVEAWETEETEKYWDKWEEAEIEAVRESEEEYLRSETGAEADGAAQFSNYSSDPGSESYRELLITLPPGEGKNPKRAPATHWDADGVIAHVRFMEKHHADGAPILFIEEIQSDWHQKGRDEGYEQAADPEKIEAARSRWNELENAAQAARADYDEKLLRLRANLDSVVTEARLAHIAKLRVEFPGSHEDDIRREAQDLFPLSWHASDNRIAIVLALLADEGLVRAEDQQAVIAAYQTSVAKRNETQGAAYLALRELDVAKGGGGGVPLAPFQSSWPSLAMKRAIRWAVDEGYTRVAWINGNQQNGGRTAQMLGGEITVAPHGDGRVVFDFPEAPAVHDAIREHGESVPGGTALTREQAVTLLGEFGGTSFDTGLNGPEVIDADEEVFSQGGWFYDRNLVNITNGLIKKYGGKVAPMPVREFRKQTPEIRRLQEAVSRAKTATRHGTRSQHTERLGYQRGVVAEAEVEASQPGVEEGSFVADRVRKEREILAAVEAVTPEAFDTLEAAQEALREAVLAAQNEPTHFGFEITPKLAEVAAGGFPLFQKTGAARGQIAFGEDITQTPSIITLLRGANLSTFLHESAHFFLQVSIDISSRPNAPDRVLKDVQTFFDWTGIRGLTEWNAMGIEEQREHHERFARGFEAYLREGKAPSLELRSLFATFRHWLLRVYRSIRALNVELTDEVRGVFDRMLATDAEIAEAHSDFGFRPAFTEKPPAMSDAEWAQYQALGADASREAVSELDRRSLNDMRYGQNAISKALKDAQRKVNGLRKAMRAEVTPEITGEPIYRALGFIRKGVLDGTAIEGEHKINIESLEALYEDKPLLYTNEVKARLRGLTAKDGVNVNQIAELFGFSTGDHLVQEIMLAAPLRDAIETEVDQRMLERYGDLTSQQAVEGAAIEAVHNDVRGRFIATELRVAAKAPGKPRVLAAAARAFAEGMIARLKIRDVRPAQFEAAERRANKTANAALASNDMAKFAVEKRNQLVNFYGARVARDALNEIETITRYLRKFEKPGTRKAIDPDYIDQIDKLLERFDLRTSVTNKQADKRKSLLSWVERQQDMGFEPVISDDLLEEANRRPYRELTVEELRDLRDAVKNIDHLGRHKKKLLTAKDQRLFAEAVDDITSEIEANAFRTIVQPLGARTWLEGIKDNLADFVAMHKKLANLIHVMGGNKYGGALWTRMMLPLNEAGDRETVMKQEAILKLRELFAVLKPYNLTKREYVPEIGRAMSLEDRLMVALNWGNEGNRQRVMDGDRWTLEQVEAILAPLDETHLMFVQSVWDYIGSFWPEIAAKERRVTGITPEKVEAFAHEVNGIAMRGGYFPIKYDPARSSKAEADTAAEVLQQMIGGKYTNAQTRRGHTKARVENVDRPVRKDFGVIFSHVNQVVHDLTHHEALIDANRLLRAAPIDAAIRDGYGPAALKWMREALNDIAVGDLPAQNGMEIGLNHLRTGATVAGLGFNLWTSLLQPVGLTQSMSRIGTRWVGRGLAEIFKDPKKMNAKLEWIYSQSSMMRNRANTMQREITELRNQISAKSPMRKVAEKAVPPEAVDAITGSYFYLIGKAQLMADVPTWLGQYEKSVASGKDPVTAARLADQAVIDSQGGGSIKDLAGVQRGSAFMKLWTNFYSYFSTTYNLMADRTAQLRRVGSADLPYYAVDMMLLTIVPATITALMRLTLKGGDDDDWWSVIATENLSYLSGTMLGLREIGAVFAGNTGYTGPAGARIFSALVDFGKQVKQGEMDEALARSANGVLGILLHYPAGQLDRTARGIDAVANGEAGPQAVLVGPPPKR